ncbi:hypothetical protein FVA74_07500 [Salinibacterium sp. dk2585]|uniref:hypothetical protein n=1 Tax=unclassified Salinibacterium TaxID=2632331 RepID=UPI0011C25403|nr:MULTISPECIES: hypothetical protein [unclassified Salinibacterium]QEE61439.1 hypothetical protein FVA74_07500 [Salinibacterium sp. dk2585]TXK54116.1 hypothetical protein FVP63_08950 [Salinibacterium sp. dk5596]
MNERAHEGGSEFSGARGQTGSIDLDNPEATMGDSGHEDSVPFDTFPPAAPTASDATPARFDGAPSTSANAIRPGSRRAQRLAETGALSFADLAAFTPAADTREAPPAPAPAPASEPDSDAHAYRLRDFRPAGSAAAAVAPPSAPAVGDASPAAAGRPLTRRELRALEAARAREAEPEAAVEALDAAPASAPFPAPAAPPQFDASSVDVAQPSTVQPSTGLADLAEAQAAPEQPQAVTEPPPLVEPPHAALASPQYIPSSLDVTGVAPAEPRAEDAVETPSDTAVPLSELAPPAGMPFGTSPTEIPTLADLPAPQLPPPPAPMGEFVPQYSLAQYPPPTMLPGSPESARGIDFAPQQQVTPVGHWSTQEALDDASQSAESVTSRDVAASTGPITSNALVLPAVPDGSDLAVPFATATGEVLITGSITLPTTLGTTGAHPARYDHSELDAIIDAADRDDIEGESAPVRAIRAVSTHTSPRDVIAMSRNSGSGNRLPVVLAITAGAMMVSVTVLVVVGFVFGTF